MFNSCACSRQSGGKKDGLKTHFLFWRTLREVIKQTITVYNVCGKSVASAASLWRATLVRHPSRSWQAERVEPHSCNFIRGPCGLENLPCLQYRAAKRCKSSWVKVLWLQDEQLLVAAQPPSSPQQQWSRVQPAWATVVKQNFELPRV